MTKELPLVSIIIVNYNGKHLLKGCFDSLLILDYPQDKIEIIMVDNGSDDGSIEYVRDKFSKVKILKNDVNNYCRANNLGIKATKGKYVALLNNDVKVDKKWLIYLLKCLQIDSTIGAVGSRILFMDGSIESLGHQELSNFYWVDQTFDNTNPLNNPKEVTSLCGCAVLYRKSAMENVGYFDEDFNMYMEDVDISLRMVRKGWKLFCAPKSFVYHIHHGTTKEDLPLFYTEKNRLLLIVKYYPKKICEALLENGYFTTQGNFKAQRNIYPLLVDLVLKLIKHHKINIVKDVLGDLFKEVKKIENHENSISIEKIPELLKTIGSLNFIIKSKDTHLINLNQEITRRDLALKEKDDYADNLNQEITRRDLALKEKNDYADNLFKTLSEQIANLNIELTKKNHEINDYYNSTAFRFLVRPLWSILWKIKQIQGFIHQPINKASLTLPEIKKEDTSNSYLTICTIISKNYLSYARVLTESFLKHNQGRVFVLLTDRIDDYFDPTKEKFILIELETIKKRIPAFDKFCFQYNPTELNTAVKPFFLEFIFDIYKPKDIIFLDPDILITSNLNELSNLLGKYSIILIPHITQPYQDTRRPSEIEILKSGVYNLGFIALANNQTTRTLLSWWKERLKRYCISDVEKGLFVDQKWIDLVPGFFEGVHILRDKTYNIAYWNFHYRKVLINEENLSVDGIQVKFMHFSGFNPDDLKVISKHQDRFTLVDLEYMIGVFELYRNKLKTHNYDETKNWPCVLNYFDNGVQIPDFIRRLYWNLYDENEKFTNPFKTEGRSFFNWLNERLDNQKPTLNRFMYAIYKKRSDLQIVYPNLFGVDRKKFVGWFLSNAINEYKLDESFINKFYPFTNMYNNGYLSILKISFFHKTREVLKKILKAILRNNSWRINNLKIIELNLYKKLEIFSRVSSKKSESRNKKFNKPNGINLIGYLTTELGIGEGARASAKCFEAVGTNLAIINIDNHSPSRQSDFFFVSKLSKINPYPINLIHINADMFSKLVTEKGTSYFNNKYNIGYWVWELNNFPDKWEKSFSYCDEIWTPSKFAYKAISMKSPIPVKVIPHAVEIKTIKQVKREYFSLQENEFIFLFMFDFFSYFERKNPLAIIKAFKQAFSANDNIRLVIKCSNSAFAPHSFRKMKKESEMMKISILDKYLYRDEINALLLHCNAYVSLHRSEGFGLTMAEAMYLGKPVIATNYSGNLDFMNSNNSYLVNYKIKEIQKNSGPYTKGNIWAEPSIEHATELMRYVYENKAKAEAMGNIAASDIKKNLNFSKIGNEMKNRIEQIYNR
ncbi:MAG: glycosyltransferase [Candidatus Omnitrophota bacterium]